MGVSGALGVVAAWPDVHSAASVQLETDWDKVFRVGVSHDL